MRYLTTLTVAACTAVLFGTGLNAQQPTPPPLLDYGPNITLEQATKAANAALAESKKLNVLEGIAVVDTAGRPVYFLKMDNARAIAVELAQDKARTAAMFKVPSKAYEDRVGSGGAGIAALSLHGVTAASGGIPIVVGGKIIGAIGVGGGPNGAIDAEAAQAGVDVLK
jgi:glc operon protein GlcG